AASRGTYLATLDADSTYPANRFPDLLLPLAEDRADFVSGDRITGLAADAMSGMHRVGNEILNLAFRRLYGASIRDSQSGMWAFRRSILPRLRLVHDGMAFSEELKLEVLRAGYRFLEIPIDYRPRVGTKKIRSTRDATENLIWLARKRVGWAQPQDGSLLEDFRELLPLPQPSRVLDPQRGESLCRGEGCVRLVHREEEHPFPEVDPPEEGLELIADHRIRVDDREAIRREVQLLRIRGADDEYAEALVAFRALEGRDLLQRPVASAACVGEPASLLHVRGVLELLHHDARDHEENPVDALLVRPHVDPVKLVEEVFPQDRRVQDVRVDPEDDVLVLGEAARDGRESDRFNEARAQQRGIQPVEVFRGVLQHVQSIFRRRAEDLQERELFLRTPRPEGRDGDPVDVSLDRPAGE